MLFRPPCAVCGQPSASIEVLDPHELPGEWGHWNTEQQRRFRQYRNDESHLLRYSGPGGSNGAVGDAIEAARAAKIVAAFSGPMTAEIMASLEFFDKAGFCVPCGKFYCPAHRPVSATGWGTCPEGHGQSLDPHWSPDLED